jgi:flagellin
MAMIVQHNMQSMNSSRMLGVTTTAQAKSTEKLSSGYKINRAADDAAGLTISEK